MLAAFQGLDRHDEFYSCAQNKLCVGAFFKSWKGMEWNGMDGIISVLQIRRGNRDEIGIFSHISP